jgi:hypothetical protein
MRGHLVCGDYLTILGERIAVVIQHQTACLVHLVYLVCLVYLVDLVYLVSFLQPKNQTNKTNKINEIDQFATRLMSMSMEQSRLRASWFRESPERY